MTLLLLAFLVAAATAAPQAQDFNSQQFISSGPPKIRILSQRFQQDISGSYEYAYDQSNGQRMEEVGRVQPGPQPETGSISQQGSYQFIADDGNTYEVSYVADENGFQPRGAHLPQPPAQIPEYEQLRRDYPQLFWAENGGAGIILNDQQQFNQRQFDQQQLNQQQFSQQQFDQQQLNQQQFDRQEFDQQQINQQQFDQVQFEQQQFDQQQLNQQQFGLQQLNQQQFDQQQVNQQQPQLQLVTAQQFDQQQFNDQQLDQRFDGQQLQQLDDQQFDQQPLNRQQFEQQQVNDQQLNQQLTLPLLDTRVGDLFI